MIGGFSGKYNIQHGGTNQWFKVTKVPYWKNIILLLA
jgi:hypothetical protein